MKDIKIISLAAVAIAALAIFSETFAAVPIPMGWYIEGGVGATKVSNTNYGSGASISNSALGFGLTAGYKFMPFFATEVGYAKYANSTIQNSAGTTAGTAKNYSFDIAAKGILPIVDSSFELFGKVGAAMVNTSVSISQPDFLTGLSLQSGSHRATNFYMGAGADYSFLPNIPLILQWARAVGDNRTGTMDLYSIGVAYIFE